MLPPTSKATFTHSIWNLLVIKSDNKDIFIGLSKISESVVFVIPFVWFLSRVGFGSSPWLLYIVLAAFFVFLYYIFLSQSYKHIDFSVAYPMARSSMLFLPMLEFMFLGGKLDFLGMLSVILVTIAVLTFQLKTYDKNEFKNLYQQLAKPGIAYALLTAFTVAAYTLWGKIAVLSKATYVGTLRQLSLVVGTFLGWKYLEESLPLPKIVSVGMIIIGSGLIAFAK